jgi:uncharacterized membrane protein
VSHQPHPALEEEAELHRTEVLVATVLRTGVLTAAALVGVGLVIHLARGGTDPKIFDHFIPVPFNLEHVSGMLRGIAALRGQSIIQLGLLVLIATPVVRVAMSVGVFVRERDGTYIVVTLIVLGALLFSLTASLR